MMIQLTCSCGCDLAGAPVHVVVTSDTGKTQATLQGAADANAVYVANFDLPVATDLPHFVDVDVVACGTTTHARLEGWEYQVSAEEVMNVINTMSSITDMEGLRDALQVMVGASPQLLRHFLKGAVTISCTPPCAGTSPNTWIGLGGSKKATGYTEEGEIYQEYHEVTVTATPTGDDTVKVRYEVKNLWNHYEEWITDVHLKITNGSGESLENKVTITGVPDGWKGKVKGDEVVIEMPEGSSENSVTRDGISPDSSESFEIEVPEDTHVSFVVLSVSTMEDGKHVSLEGRDLVIPGPIF